MLANLNIELNTDMHMYFCISKKKNLSIKRTKLTRAYNAECKQAFRLATSREKEKMKD